jgi:hypothetical protein
MSTAFDDGLSTIIDSTTSATYTYIYKALSPTALITDSVWACKRIVNATGTGRYADGVSDLSNPSLLMTVAEGLTATYTAG